MRRVCAWCNEAMDASSENAEDRSGPVTHGICAECVRKVFYYRSKPLSELLNLFADPVFLVNSEGRVTTANAAALSMLGKDHSDIKDRLGGDVFGCSYADQPGGCGHTTHCKTCTIRNTVTDTLETGRNHEAVAAYPDLHFITEEQKVRFLISTEKAGDAVLLRIDDVREEPVS